MLNIQKYWLKKVITHCQIYWDKQMGEIFWYRKALKLTNELKNLIFEWKVKPQPQVLRISCLVIRYH
jgi:hypothetical protein